ncbi:hypothetical protein BHM03_00062363 [Ensete ventricosum]|nr:hypothetical protein BHM03_00062363 [Ensete ventricosum]
MGRPAAAKAPLQGGGCCGRLQPRHHYKGAAGCGQAPCKGRLAAAKAPLQGAATRRGNSLAGMTGCDQPARGSRPRLGRKWWLPAARPQGAASRPGLPPARVAAGRSGL